MGSGRWIYFCGCGEMEDQVHPDDLINCESSFQYPEGRHWRNRSSHGNGLLESLLVSSSRRSWHRRRATKYLEWLMNHTKSELSGGAAYSCVLVKLFRPASALSTHESRSYDALNELERLQHLRLVSIDWGNDWGNWLGENGATQHSWVCSYDDSNQCARGSLLLRVAMKEISMWFQNKRKVSRRRSWLWRLYHENKSEKGRMLASTIPTRLVASLVLILDLLLNMLLSFAIKQATSLETDCAKEREAGVRDGEREELDECDSVLKPTQADVEEAIQLARRSASDVEFRGYEAFTQNMKYSGDKITKKQLLHFCPWLQQNKSDKTACSRHPAMILQSNSKFETGFTGFNEKPT